MNVKFSDLPPEIWIKISHFMDETKLNLFFINTEFFSMIDLLTDFYDIFNCVVKCNYMDVLKYIINLKQTSNPKFIDFILVDLDIGIYLASMYGHLHIVKYFILLGNYPKGKHNECLCKCNHSMIIAATQGHLEIVKYFINFGIDIDCFEGKAIRKSAKKGHFNMVKYLLTKGANVKFCDDYAVRYAARYGHFDIVKMLFDYKADIRACNDYAYRSAKKLNHKHIVEYIETLAKKSDWILTKPEFNDSIFSKPITSKNLQKFHNCGKAKKIYTKQEKINYFNFSHLILLSDGRQIDLHKDNIQKNNRKINFTKH
ncbi:putative ankyrin repeat protein [Cotonvirus japonicus]|uniref:Ankyrin repeat protein n=1 Tax=Cotonvirus japonicus TaxID=2811091 RepID=A0ABM7NRI7_9VIRU|nr:putative ankyrin repeat protein [Cotonvirus japonicus]BCS82775.1 putative ankyrin repeat protein [Cotonvirus japonicus]